MNIVEIIEMYLPEIMIVLGVLIPTMPTLITKVVSDVRTKRLLATFKEQQSKLTTTASKYTVDVGRLEMNIEKLENLPQAVEEMKADIDMIRSALGIRKPTNRE